MKKTKLSLTIAAVVLAPMVLAEDSLTDALTAGEAHLNFRLMYEDVDQDNPIDRDANALTLRTQLNYKSATYQGFTGFVELDDITALDDDYNSTTNGRTDKAVIADPEGSEVNQAWVNYQNWDTNFKWGRQRINLDNQRFVGGVAFRQNEQTYDGFSATNTSLTDTTFFIAQINNVNRIFGEDSPGGNHESNSQILNVQYRGLPAGTLTGYAYLLENEDAAMLSSDTIGVRFTGKYQHLSYTLEYAMQEDSNNNPNSYDTDYWLAEASLPVSDFNLKAGYELLGSDNGVGFATPLATTHKFQGWADQFLATPGQGIADLYFSAGTKFAGLKLLAVYHDFTSDVENAADDDDLGSEFNFLVAKPLGKYNLSFKYASYSSGDDSFGKSDTDKLWLIATANF
jgi:Alginate export